MSKKIILKVAIIFSCLALTLSVVYAQDSSSTNFIINGPVLNPGGFSTSTSFSLSGIMSQIGIGSSTAPASVFKLFGGFLYFPFVSTPTVVATAGVQSVDLSWTASDSALGWSVSGYSVGQSTTAGGPYTYTNLGNVLLSTRSSLTAGTTYYFVLIPKDTFGNFIATSTEASATPTASSGGGGGGGGGSSGGGGGGGGGGTPATGGTGDATVIFSGRAYPKSVVTILKDAQVAVTTVAGLDGKFQVALSKVSAGNFIFSVYGEDKNGLRSSLSTFPVGITAGATTNVTGIFLSPTITTDKSEVKRGETITIFGQTTPDSNIVITVNSEQEFFLKSNSGADGVYLYNFDSSLLEYGGHTGTSKSTFVTEISPLSKATAFKVGNRTVFAGPSTSPAKGDVNGYGKVNLVDFSITAYWYKRPISAVFALVESTKLNGDGKVDLIDFSIMAYYWTG